MMTILWIILGAPVLILLSSWDEVLMMALDAIPFGRGDDKPARRRRLAGPSNALPQGGERVSQRLSLFRRSRPIDAGATVGPANGD
jgi:hypothetical protein